MLVPVLGLSLLSAYATYAAEQTPNFVIIFTDDQGYQDLGCYGSPDIKTPNIDRMANEGMRFTSFYQHQALRAVRQGDWKLHLPHSELDRTKEGMTWQRHVPKLDRPYIEELTLYNLKEDIGETKNVAKQHPTIVERLSKQLVFAKQDIGYHDQIGENSRRRK